MQLEQLRRVDSPRIEPCSNKGEPQWKRRDMTTAHSAQHYSTATRQIHRTYSVGNIRCRAEECFKSIGLPQNVREIRISRERLNGEWFLVIRHVGQISILNVIFTRKKHFI